MLGLDLDAVDRAEQRVQREFLARLELASDGGPAQELVIEVRVLRETGQKGEARAGEGRPWSQRLRAGERASRAPPRDQDGRERAHLDETMEAPAHATDPHELAVT